MAKHQAADIRNVALIGHGAVGKTTLADLLLFKSGAATRAGSVDDGSSVLDTDEEAKHHKHSITSTVVHFSHAGKYVNVIDTPGYPDFIGQAIGALRAVETAVIVFSASAGIEVNTRRTFNLAGQEGLGRMIVVNKCDLDNLNFERILDSIRETFGTACVPMNLPVGLGANFSGVVSTLDVPASVPAEAVADPKEWNQPMMDAIVEADESLMERYLEGEQLTPQEISSGLSKAVAAGTLIPVFFTSFEIWRRRSRADGRAGRIRSLAGRAAAKGDERRRSRSHAHARPPTVRWWREVFKTRIDPFVARMSFIRVFSGTLKKDMSVHAHGAEGDQGAAAARDAGAPACEPGRGDGRRHRRRREGRRPGGRRHDHQGRAAPSRCRRSSSPRR